MVIKNVSQEIHEKFKMQLFEFAFFAKKLYKAQFGYKKHISGD